MVNIFVNYTEHEAFAVRLEIHIYLLLQSPYNIVYVVRKALAELNLLKLSYVVRN